MTIHTAPTSVSPAHAPASGVSVLILTLNEEINLPACLASLAWCDDIVVLDSFSTDRTVEIARAAGARVYQREHDSERGQRSYGLSEITFRHDWVYMPDADEITTPELRDEILRVTSDPARRESAYRVRFKVMFMGRWIRHSSLYPTWVVRLVRPAEVRLERDFHTACYAAGGEGELHEHFLHYSFNKGMTAWFEKHNRYSTHEARESLLHMRGHAPSLKGLFSRDARIRRRTLKQASYWLPCRPMLRFLYMYLLRGGILDGRAGLVYCRLIACYEQMIVTKIAELRRREGGLPL